MTPAQAIDQAKRGKLLPLYLVAGEEPLVRDEVVSALREACLAGGVAAFNEDKFTAGEADVDAIIAAARTVPMMARRRLVVVRGIERWEATTAEGSPFDRLAEYAASPCDSTCVLLVGSKLDGRRKLAALARKQGLVVSCDPLDTRALPAWIVARFNGKGHTVSPEVAELLAAIAGPHLSALDDAVERVSLYVGPGAPIDEDAVGVCVARVRAADTWALVDAVGARDLAAALRTLADGYDPRDRGLPMLGALAWSVRQLARFQAAIESGATADDAAHRVGAFSPARARDLASKARAIRASEVRRWMLVLAQTDRALKSSRRPADAILEDMLTRLCDARVSASARARPI